jgi:integrase
VKNIENRSRYLVKVKGRSDLTQEFPFHREDDAVAYLHKLRSDGHRPVLTQAEDQLWVRIREKGFKPFSAPASSMEEARDIIETLRQERKRGLFVDYRQGHLVTGADLLQQYLESEVPRHKASTREWEECAIQGWLEDSRGDLQRRMDERVRAIAAGEVPEVIRARRIPRRNLEWLHKPFAAIVPTDVESYVHERLDADDLAPATVDRELDLWSAVCNWAIKVLRIHVAQSPMEGVRRPRYFNQRDRRLTEDEKARLLEAARAEDRARSREIAINARLEAARADATRLPNRTARNRHIAAARRIAIAEVGESYPVIPLYEPLIEFYLVTAARRGEALNLLWSNLDLDGQSALFLKTKNGTDRRVPIRREAIPCLRRLQCSGDRVFPITVDDLKGAWSRMCERAGITDFHLHDLRHTAISEMVEAAFAAGVPLSVLELQGITGHKDLASLARYTHLCGGHLARRLDEAFRKSRELGRSHKGRTRAWSPRSIGPTEPSPSSDCASQKAPPPAHSPGTAATLEDTPYNRVPI